MVSGNLISEGPWQAQRVKSPPAGTGGKTKGNKGSKDNVHRTEWTIHLNGPRLVRLTLPLVAGATEKHDVQGGCVITKELASRNGLNQVPKPA